MFIVGLSKLISAPLLLFNCYYLHQFLSWWDIIIVWQKAAPLLACSRLSSPLSISCEKLVCRLEMEATADG